jgi:hypothetical protein
MDNPSDWVEELKLRKHGNINAYPDEAGRYPYSFQIQKQPPPNSIRKLFPVEEVLCPLTLISVTTTRLVLMIIVPFAFFNVDP